MPFTPSVAEDEAEADALAEASDRPRGRLAQTDGSTAPSPSPSPPASSRTSQTSSREASPPYDLRVSLSPDCPSHGQDRQPQRLHLQTQGTPLPWLAHAGWQPRADAVAVGHLPCRFVADFPPEPFVAADALLRYVLAQPGAAAPNTDGLQVLFSGKLLEEQHRRLLRHAALHFASRQHHSLRQAVHHQRLAMRLADQDGPALSNVEIVDLMAAGRAAARKQLWRLLQPTTSELLRLKLLQAPGCALRRGQDTLNLAGLQPHRRYVCFEDEQDGRYHVHLGWLYEGPRLTLQPLPHSPGAPRPPAVTVYGNIYLGARLRLVPEDGPFGDSRVRTTDIWMICSEAAPA